MSIIHNTNQLRPEISYGHEEEFSSLSGELTAPLNSPLSIDNRKLRGSGLISYISDPSITSGSSYSTIASNLSNKAVGRENLRLQPGDKSH